MSPPPSCPLLRQQARPAAFQRELQRRRRKPGAPLPLLKPHGLGSRRGGRAARGDHDGAPRGGGETGATLPLRVPAAARAAADPPPAPARPNPTPRASAASPRGPASPPPPLKTAMAAAGGWLRNARPPHGRAGPKLGRARRVPAPRRPGEAGPGARRPRRAATHPQTGSPGSRSSGTWTAASRRPAQPQANHMNRGGGGGGGDSCAAIGGGRAGAQRHPGAGRGGRARLPPLLARAPNRPEPPRGPALKPAHVTAAAAARPAVVRVSVALPAGAAAPAPETHGGGSDDV